MLFKKIVNLLLNFIKLSPNPSLSIKVSAHTNIGLTRENNEDSYLNLPEYQLWAVADGMGGHEGGEVASAIAINQLKNETVKGKKLIKAIEQAHHAIIQAGIDGLGAKNMGSTIVALQIKNNQYQISWVGDSRAYHYRSTLKCLSKDHSYIQLMLDQGLIKEEELESHPYKHAITQYLGEVDKQIQVDTVVGSVKTGDLFLICSDGLSDQVSDYDIENTMSNHFSNITEKAKQLIELALAAGGKDNITLILVEIE